MRYSFFYDFSNYGSYEQLTDDGITQWHPAFLELGNSLDECARKYKGFCQRYRPKKKKQTVNSWGSRRYGQIKLSKTPKPTPLGQMKLPFAHHSPTTTIIQPDINQATLPFIKANRQSICNLA